MDPTPNPGAPDQAGAAPTPAGTPAPPEPQFDPNADPETLAVEVERPAGKVSMVPLPALKEERARAKALRDEKAALQQRAAEMEQQIRTAEPILRFFEQNPALLSQAQGGQPPARTEPTEDEKDAFETARALGAYTTTGQPDMEVGKAILAIMDRRTGRAVQPVQRMSAQQQAEANFQKALTARDGKGRPYARPETIQRVFSMMPPELAADPKVAQLLLDTARGQDFDHISSLPTAPAGAPIFSEIPGGHIPQDDGLTPEEQRTARNLGVSEKDWKASTTGRPGGLWAPFKE